MTDPEQTIDRAPHRAAVPRWLPGVLGVLEILGLALIAIGAGLIYLPAGVIVGGLALVLLGNLSDGTD